MPHPSPTERLTFRELTLADVDNLQLIFSDPVAMEFYPSTKDLAATREWINRTRANYERVGHGLWAVSLAETGEFLGQCGLLPQNIRGWDEVEIGYSFRRAHWGNGYATEAARACRDHAFRNLPVQQLVSYISPGNERSKNVARRVGMSLDRLLAPSENRWRLDIHVFAMRRTA